MDTLYLKKDSPASYTEGTDGIGEKCFSYKHWEITKCKITKSTSVISIFRNCIIKSQNENSWI